MSNIKKDNPKHKHRTPKKPLVERDRTIRKEKVDFHITEKSTNATAMPVDFTFQRYKEIQETGTEFASRSRLGTITLGHNKKFLSQSFWLNNNMIRNIKNIDKMIESVIEYPDRLGFLDLSHNQIKEIDAGLLKFQNLKVLYLHDNKITKKEEVFKLRDLKKLQHLTLFGNPFYEKKRLGNIRTVVKNIVPQIKKLDFNRLAGIETELPLSAYVLRFLEEKEGRVPSYIPCKSGKYSRNKQSGKEGREKYQDLDYARKSGHEIRDGIDTKGNDRDLEVECVCYPIKEECY